MGFLREKYSFFGESHYINLDLPLFESDKTNGKTRSTFNLVKKNIFPKS